METITYSKKTQADEAVGRHFTVAEFAAGDSDEVKIGSEIVGYLDDIREHFGSPVTIISGYRTDALNKQMGGAKDSYHLKGQAADISIGGIAPKEIAVYAESVGVPGIGLNDYEDGEGYVHLDSRKVKRYWIKTGKDGELKTVPTHGAKPDIFSEAMPVIRRGCSGYAVRIWQKIIGVSVDGDFGSKTEAATVAWQKTNSLAADGVVDKLTWGKAHYKIKN
jgi:peptidoglycan hydrolase-like protein with peptidoglycan-binding domain